MIFEFLKNLFWKADEGNRKRKATEGATNSEDNLPVKKRCHDFASSNHVKINSDFSGNGQKNLKYNSCIESCGSLNMNQSNLKNNTHKIELLNSSIHWSPSKDISSKKTIEKKCSPFQKSDVNKFILFKSQRLLEKRQYEEMLSNFLPPDQKFEKVRQSISPDNSNKVVHINRVDVLPSSNHNLLEISKKDESYTNGIFNSSDYTRKYKFYHEYSTINRSDQINKQLVNEFYKRIPVEMIQVNTLKDKLSMKEVTKQDFVNSIKMKYSERIEQRHKEAEELKKLTYILSKHNQLTREAALEEQLNRSMRLCEAILDESDFIEKSRLPELDAEMMVCIKNALSSGSSDQAIVEGFGLKISKRDIQTLADLNWLNDEVINFYMNLLIERGNREDYPSVYAMNTFFYPKLISGGHASLKRWTRKVDIFSKDIIVVPIHLGIHWCMSIIDFRNKSICYYDSMGSPNYKCLQVLKQYLYDESIDKKKKSFDFSGWNLECVKDIPQQMNGSDCGVFSCMFAEYVCANKDFNFSQEDMPFFRNKMIYEILSVKLL